jgi:hypothetical protein
MLVYAQLRSGYGTSVDLLDPSNILAIQKVNWTTMLSVELY